MIRPRNTTAIPDNDQVVKEKSADGSEGAWLPNGEERLVAVVIPSYNHAKFIRQAIKSVADQTYKNIELIIVDDGSTDGSPAVIENALRDAGSLRSRLFVQGNRGAHDAINRGIETARGEYISILDSDDFYYPDRIERLLKHAVCDSCEFVFSRIDHVSSNGSRLDWNTSARSLYMSAYEGVDNYPTVGHTLINYNLAVTTSNFFMTRSLINRVGPFHAYKAVHDWDYILRVLLETEPCFLDEPLLAYRVHAHNTLPRLTRIGMRENGMIFRAYASAFASGRVHNCLAPLPRSLTATGRDA